MPINISGVGIPSVDKEAIKQKVFDATKVSYPNLDDDTIRNIIMIHMQTVSEYLQQTYPNG